MRHYFYGVIESAGGLNVFVHRKQSKIPNNAWMIKECWAPNRDEATAIARRDLSHAKFRPGEIVIYADNQGQHTAIVLHSMEHESYFAFVTTNPHWGSISRKILKDEQSLLGYPDKGRTSYFTPVIRDNDMAVSIGRSYPLHRVKELIREFDEYLLRP